MRATISRGYVKVSPFDRIPLLFSRLGYDDGIRERCIAQYAEPLDHCRRSHDFLKYGSDPDLRTAIDEMRHPQDLDDEELRTAVHGVRDGRLDDSYNEIPHPHFTRLHNGAPSSTFVWKAVTLSMPQSLDDATYLSAAANVDLQSVWNSYEQLLQKGKN